MAPAGLSAVLRSRYTNSLASQGSIIVAALRGTCSYPWRRWQCVSSYTNSLFFKGLIITKQITVLTKNPGDVIIFSSIFNLPLPYRSSAPAASYQL